MPLDPQLQALQDSLNNHISGGQLVLSAQTMGTGSPPVIALFQQALGRADITIGGTISIVPDNTNDKLLVSGTGVTTLFGVTGMAVAFTFGSATPTTLSVTGTLTPPAAPVWRFSTSFPDLAETCFDQLAFTTPMFTLSTYVWSNSTLRVTVVQGAGLFILPTAWSGPLASAPQLVSGTIPFLPIYGPVTVAPGSRTIALSMPFPAVQLQLTGFPSFALPSPALVLRNEQRPAEWLDTTSISVEGAASFGFAEAPLAIGLPFDEGWSLNFIPAAQPIPSVSSFLALFTGLDFSGAMPSGLLELPGFWLTVLSAEFDLATGVAWSWSFTMTTAPSGLPPSATVWSIIPGVLDIRDLTVTLAVTIVEPGGIGAPQTQIRGSIIGVFRVANRLDLRIVIPIPVTQTWVFETANSIALPSLGDLATLVGGIDLSRLLPEGVGNIGALTISSIVLTLDPVQPAIVSFAFSVTSTNDWKIIPNRLEVKNLLLEFHVDRPFTTRVTTGLISGTLGIGSWDIDVMLERAPFEIDWSMEVSAEALPLPSISDLDQLANTGLTPYLPQTLATASFTVYDLVIAVNLSQRQIRQIAFSLESDQKWVILENVLVIERAGLNVDLSWYSGDLLASFGVWGALEVATKRINVSADRNGQGEWTFTGALAEGETISLTGLVRQFLTFLPAYLPTLEVEGIAVTFETPSNDYSLKGRTAGFWTFEVSSALTLRMRASAAFRRTAGAMSGDMRGEFFVNSVSLVIGYSFNATSTTLTFQFIYGRFNLTAALTSGTNAKGVEYSLLSFRLGDLSVGDILTTLINLAAPGREFSLQSPWDALNQINLRNLSLVVDLKTRDVTVTYDINVNLVFIAITGIGLKYDTSSGEGSVKMELAGRFLNQEYSFANGTPLEWDVLHEPPPSVPAKGPDLFELRYLGLGQHVSFTSIKALNSVGDVIAALRAQMTPVRDATKNPLASGNGSAMRFDRASQVLIGADFTLLSTLSAAFVFNDPYLYGLRLALAGARAGSLAGLEFELLYKRITNDIGVFKVELRVPDAFRQFEFGEVSITLPVIKVDVYTNGNFRVDLGFPRNGDFSDSFCLQVFPFIGYGGFYFAKLTGATSERVPVIRDGSFDPVIEFGVGLQVGLGKEIRKGPLAGGIYVTVVGILEGTVAWYTPANAAASDGLYYWIEGIVGIVGKVYGEIDFAVIKVSVRLEARLSVRLVLEAYEATHVQVSVDVEAEASVTILFVEVSFSFSVSLKEEFVIGSSSTPPWREIESQIAGEQPRLRMQRTLWRRKSRAHRLRLQTYSAAPTSATWKPWDPILMFAAKQDLPLSLLPALTVATPVGSSTPALQIDFLLLAENSVQPGARTREERRTATAAHSSRTTDPMALSFNLLIQAMLKWSIYSVTGLLTGNVTAGDLERAYELLGTADTFNTGFARTNLQDFLAANFNVQISSVPANVELADPTSSTVVAMLPPLSYTYGQTIVDFSQFNPVSPDYEEVIRRYYDQLLVDFEYGRAIDPATQSTIRARAVETAAGDESMATLIFREFMMIVAKAAVQAARDALGAFTYPVTQTDSLDTIAGNFPSLMTTEGALAVSSSDIAWANREVAVTASKPWTLQNLAYQVRAGDSLTVIATTTFGLTNAASVIAVAANAGNRQLLTDGVAMTIAQPVSSDYTWFNYLSVAGDTLQSIAVWAFVRAQASDPQPNGAWYAQTIVNFNTDPQHPYAGPDLVGVLATGTSLLVPVGLNNSNKSQALTYTTRAGDTLALVAAYYDVLQNAPQLLQAIETGLQQLNPGVDWQNLPAGTAIKVPAQTYTVVSSDSFASIASRFLLAPTDLAYGGNAASSTLLAPLAVLALPDVTYSTGSADTFASVAEKFNTTVADLATAVASVQGIFKYPVSLTIPDVPSYPIASLLSVVVSGYANDVAMSTSRFLASGLRLPVPNVPTPSALYALTGQQVTCPTPPATFTFSSSASWITFVQSIVVTPQDDRDQLCARHPRLDALNPALPALRFRPGLHLLTDDDQVTLPITITQTFLDTYAPSTTFDPHIESGPSPLVIKQQTRVSFRLDRSLHWQAPAAPPFAGTATAPTAGEPSIWLFSQALEDRAAVLGWGKAPFALFTTAGDPTIEGNASAVSRYDWATIINLSVRPAASAQGADSLPNTYEIVGSDADGKARLLALLDYLTTANQTDTASVFILYEPNADTNNPKGLASASLTAATTFILRANLSTITASGPHGAVLTAAPAPGLYAAPITNATGFIQLLWEASVTASGGYYLNYTDIAGNGLPASLFAAAPLGTLRIVVILATQSASVAPSRVLYAFNNCAVVGDNIDASVQTVFADAADAANALWRESASIPPGNAGFMLTRTNPGAGDTPALRTQKLYSLLAYNSIAGPGFTASNEGLPISPDRGDATATDVAPWRYSHALRLAKLTASILPVAPFLPAASADPYAGIGPSAAITLAMAFHDVYGNDTVSQAPIANVAIPVGYYDDVVGLAQWPGIATSYHVTGNATAPAIEIDAALQVSSYVPGGGTSFDLARKNASAHLTRLQTVYYQIWQPGVSLTLTTSLVQPPQAAPTPFPVDIVAFGNFVSAACIFLGTALQLTRATQTAGSGTFSSIARTFTADPRFLAAAIASLGEANQDTPTASLFSASLSMPQLYTVAFGDSLTSIVQAAGSPAITVVQLATSNASVELNAGTDLVAPARTSAAVTATTKLSDVAKAMSASAGAIGQANAATQGLLAAAAPLTVNGVTVHVGVDPLSQKTWSLADLVPQFANLGVTATPAIIAVANQDLVGMFALGQTLTVTDYIINAGDTFQSLQQTYPAFTINALATAAANTPNIFIAGTPLFVRAAAPVPPSATQTLRALSDASGLTVGQIAVANQQTALVSTAAIALPDRVTIDAGASTALAPYTTPSTGVAIATIAQTFHEVDSYTFANRNWTMRYVFVPLQTIAIGTASTPTQTADSFGSVYDRLHQQDSSITPQSFITAIASSTTLIRRGALFAAILPSAGATATSLRSLGGAYGCDPLAIAQINASLVGFVASGVPVKLGTQSLTSGTNDTFTSLVQRFAQTFDVQTTVADLASANLDEPLIAATQRFVLPPSALSTTVALTAPGANPPYPGNPFRLTVDLAIARDSQRIDPQFANVPAVKSASARLAPQMIASNVGEPLSLDTFARGLERVYTSLKVAVGGDASSASGARDIWIVNFGSGGVTSIVIAGASPTYFALPPRATSLQDLTGVAIRTFDPGTGKLVPETDPPLFDLQSVDLDVWTAICFGAIDQLLTPAYAAPAYRLNPSAFTLLVGAKQQLADRVSAQIAPILGGTAGVKADAVARLRQQLLVSLASGYATNAIVQYPVTVSSTFTTAATAPRLVCDLRDDVFKTGAQDDINTVAAFYQVPKAAIAMLLLDVVRILAVGTAFTFKSQPFTIQEGDTISTLIARVGAASPQDFVANLATPTGFFAPYTVLNIDRVDGKSGDASPTAALLTFADLVEYFHTPLPLLATSIQDTTGLFANGVTITVPDHGSITISATNNSLTLAAAALHFDLPYQLAEAIQLQIGILDPQFPIGIARLVPEHSLSAAKLSLYNGQTTMNAVFGVKSASRARNMFLRPDLHINELEYDIVSIANEFDASRWLSLVVPIAEATTPLKTDLGEALIPIPLRAYPMVPSMMEQGGQAGVTTPTDVTSAKLWRYGFSYQTHLAAQDTLYVDTTFNVPLGATLNAADMVPPGWAALAQFVSAWNDVSTALTALLTWDGSANPVLAQTVQTVADMANGVATTWSGAEDASPGTQSTTYSYRLSTTVRRSADGLMDYLDTLRVTVLSGAGPSPTGAFPTIAWRHPSGEWFTLDLKSHTTTDAVYAYTQNVPSDDTVQHQLTFDALDVVAWQNASGSTRLTRNEHLVSRAATNPAFIYGTSIVGFAQPALPLIQHDDVIVFNDGLSLSAAITRLFTTLLGSLAPTQYWIKLSVEFGYEVVSTIAPTPPLVSFLPIGFLPTSQYDATVADRVYQLISTWRTGKPFGPHQGLFAIDVTVFTTLTPIDAAKVPILRLPHLVYDNADAPAAMSLATRLWSGRRDRMTA